MPVERWRTVQEFDGLYRVSDQGRVKSLHVHRRGRVDGILREGVSRKGYRSVLLYRGGEPRRYTIHRLVLEAFVGTRPSGKQCNHLDGNKANNHLSNLEWVTPRANSIHAMSIGLVPASVKLNPKSVSEAIWLHDWGMATADLAGRYGVSRSSMEEALRGTTWGWTGLR